MVYNFLGIFWIAMSMNYSHAVFLMILIMLFEWLLSVELLSLMLCALARDE